MSGELVPYVDLAAQWADEKTELLPLIDEQMALGKWVGGDIVEEFESRVAELCGSQFAVALNSGTDALTLGLAACGIRPGDEVITVPNSFIATAAAIAHLGAVPVFVDVLPDQTMDPDQLAVAVSDKTKAVLPVHLTGRMAKMDAITDFARERGLMVIEDAAQSIGSQYKEISSGTWSDVGCFSTHPLKNLNALGDGGFLLTDSPEVARRTQILRSHGLVDRSTALEFGYVSRMDSLQATVLLYRMTRLQGVIQRRRAHAESYRAGLAGLPLDLPLESPDYFDTFHTFVVQAEERDALQRHLADRGIGSAVHYPLLITDQPAIRSRPHRVVGTLENARRQSKRILSLPVHQSLRAEQIDQVIEAIREFYQPNLV